MTVAAVILAPDAEGALATVDGLPRVRRAADLAWAAGALPVIVVTPDPDGRVAAALEGSAAELVEPRDVAEGRRISGLLAGITAARTAVAATSAALAWPARMTWVDAGTVTALIEAHGREPDAVLRPTWRDVPGWPALVPLAHLDALPEASTSPRAELEDDLTPGLAAAGVFVRTLDLGDPGSVLDADTSRDALPAFEGPSEPIAGHPPEWGAAVAPAGEP